LLAREVVFDSLSTAVTGRYDGVQLIAAGGGGARAAG